MPESLREALWKAKESEWQAWMHYNAAEVIPPEKVKELHRYAQVVPLTS